MRPLTAARLLAIWRESREAAEEPLERSLLCNAQVLAECCFFRGERVFPDAKTVLEQLTGRQMEALLGRLAGEELPETPEMVNAGFDLERFWELERG